MKTRLRLGIFIDSDWIKNWQLDAINRLLDENLAELVGIYMPNGKAEFSSRSWPLAYRLLDKILRKDKTFQSVSFKKEFPNCPIQQLKLSAEKSETLSQEALSIIESEQLDVILRFGFGILKGKILSIPKHGIWSFHHGNPREFRGGPPGFWEYYLDKNSQGLILQQLNEKLDGGIILREGNLAVFKHDYWGHQSRIFNTGADFPRWVAKAIQSNSNYIKEQVPMSELGKLYRMPKNRIVLLFFLKMLYRKVKFHYKQLFQSEIWNIGIAVLEDQELPLKNIKNIDWAPIAKRGIYYADPFFHPKEKTVYFEEYDYKNLKGKISSINYNGGWANVSNAIKKLTHLSYPFAIENGGKNYILPEEHQNKELSLYEIIDKDLIKKQTLLKGSWVDPTLVKHNDLWWLFCTPIESSNEQLFLFYSDSLEGNYNPHPMNPIKIDISSARPGGTLYLDEKNRLIRPSQNSSITYGGSIKLNHIQVLNKEDFREECLSEVFQEMDSDYPTALHTFSIQGHHILIDGKKQVFIFASFWSQLKRKFRKFIPW